MLCVGDLSSAVLCSLVPWLLPAGENEQEQLLCVMEVHGLPPRRLLERATRRQIFFDSNWAPRIVPNSAGRKRLPGSLDLAAVLRCNDVGFISFLKVGIEHS